MLGSPLRLQYDKTGTVRFSQSGKPVIRVVKELSDNVNMVKANFEQSLIAHADGVKMALPTHYKAQVDLAVKMPFPIIAHDRNELSKALEAKAEAEAKAKAEAEANTPELIAVS